MKYCTVCKSKFDDGVSFCPTDGEVLEDDPSSIVGTVLDGQYKIESLLGKGGMGAVYLARHILLGDRVAIKILPPEVRNNAEWLRRFRREGQAARRFRHANAVTVYDLRTAGDGTIYMVMEYVEGHTLEAELRKRGRFTPRQAFEILEPIMSVLNTAHAMGVVHRDLKPENIMIGNTQSGGESTVKLLDLGIAKMREIAGVESSGTTELTMAGQVLGTPYYMSPEQWGELARDGNPEIDGRTDIYSLGLVTYQMITGQRPYSGGTLHELRREHLAVKPPPLAEKVPGVPKGFSEAIDRAISKDRGDRQATAGELAAQLRASLTEATGDVPLAGDFPLPPTGAPAYTQEAPGGITSKSDVNAATILTVEAVPTSPPSVPPSTGEQPQYQQATPGLADEMQSVVTVVKPARVEVGLAPPRKSRAKSLVIAGGVVLLLGLLVVGVGGFFAMNWLNSKPDNATTGTASKDKSAAKGTNGSTTERAVAGAEVGRYWLEVLPNTLAAEPERTAGLTPLASGQAFKFHFQFGDNGYLYIVGPGQQSQPTAFLTDQPAAISGLTSNQVTKGGDFNFPSGIEHWLELDKKAGTEEYTIIFSRERLSEPTFFTAAATGNPLSETQQSELRDFLAKYKTSEAASEVGEKDSSDPFVKVKMPQTTGAGANVPVLFLVRIQHK
ncbi:MAG TPA: serine/threonine-protein kinase [Pyrinomonadaceae bacterium]|nr:serine/threonine-protein kinase [Pyrinomonadaceae bacterium]